MLTKLKKLSIAHNKKRVGSMDNDNDVTSKTQRLNNFLKKGNQRKASCQLLPKNTADAVTCNIVIRKSSVPCYYNSDVHREDGESDYERSVHENNEKVPQKSGKIFAKENYYGKNCVIQNRKSSVPCYYYRNIDGAETNGGDNPKKEDGNNVLNIAIENNCEGSQSCPNLRKNSDSPTSIRVVAQPKDESRNGGGAGGAIRKLSASVQQFFNSPNMLMVSQRFAMPQNVTATTATILTTSSTTTESTTPTCTGYSPPIAIF